MLANSLYVDLAICALYVAATVILLAAWLMGSPTVLVTALSLFAAGLMIDMLDRLLR